MTGNGRTIVWNSFNKPVLVTGHGGKVEMVYGPEQQLIRTVDRSAITPVTTTYVNPVFEVVSSGGSTEYRHNLKAGNETVAVVRQGGVGPSTLYLHRDHLDSIVAVTDSQGQVVDRRHYDAFGKERHGVAAPGSAEALTPLLKDHGYTGHRQLASVSLVHMGGRVYDPEVGRFLSADPFVQAPLFTQSYNRYSYVLNNPLSLNDPSGYFSWNPFKWVANVVKAVVDFVGDVVHAVVKTVGNVFREIGKFVAKYWKPIVVTVVAVVVSVYTSGALSQYGGVWAAGAWANVTVSAAAGGAAAGLVATGTLEGALKGGAIAGLTAMVGYGLQSIAGTIGQAAVEAGRTCSQAVTTAAAYVADASQVLFQGVVGGMRSVLSGGRFEQGFLSSSFNSAFAPAIAFAGYHGGDFAGYGTAILGAGVSSELAGGRFEDGAGMMGVLRLAGGFFNYASRKTDDAKMKAFMATADPDEWPVYDERGVMETAGQRGNYGGPPDSLLDFGAMAREGSGEHWWDDGQVLESRFIKHMVTDTSKVHDWYNSWGYTEHGLYDARHGTLYDTGFDAYSLAGMVPCWGVAMVGVAGNQAFEMQMGYYNSIKW